MAKKGFYSIIASLATSLLLASVFYFLAAIRNIYSRIDIAGGMIFVFILSMIVSASIFPAIVEKILGGGKNGDRSGLQNDRG